MKNYTYKIISFLIILLFIIGYSNLKAQVNSFPFSTSFELASDLGTSSSDVNSKWTSYIGSSGAGPGFTSENYFQRKSGATGSTGTGPSSANDGTYYVYTETSDPYNVYQNDAALQCKFDFSGKTAGNITFDYHVYGSAAELYFCIYDHGTSAYLDVNLVSAGTQTAVAISTSSSNSWYSGSLNLDNYGVSGKTVTIVFYQYLPSSSYTGDVGIDDVTVNATDNCTSPATQASSLSFTNHAKTSTTLNWTRGNGNSVMVVARSGSAPTDPSSGTSYSANAAYGSGDACGSGYVVYNGTGTSVDITNLTNGTTYYYNLYEYNSTGTCYNTTELAGNETAGWCVPTVTSCCDASGVDRVVFSNLDNTDVTNNDNSSYEDFTGSVSAASISTGLTYDLSVYSETNGYYTYHTKAFVDWNKDGDFDDANENYDLGTLYNSSMGLNSLCPLSITVPAGAVTGTNFIRIASKYNSDPTACTMAYGEFEDYALTISSPNTFDGSTSSDWNTASNWSTNSVPTASDFIIIPDASGLTNNPKLGSASDVCSGLIIQSGGVLTSDNNSYKLTAGSIDLQSGGSIVISDGELECTGKFDHDGGLTMSGGTLDINGEYESSASATETISAGTITVAGEWDGANDDAFTPTGGTVTMDGTSDKNLAQHASSNFWNLTIGNSSGDVDVTAALDIDGNLTINSGADLDIGSSGINIELAGSYANSGTFTISGETITFDGTGSETCAAISDATAIMYVSKSSGSVTTTGNISVDELRVTSGTLVIDGETVTVDDQLIVSGGTLQITSGELNSTYDDSNYSTISGGTIDVDGGTANFGGSSIQWADLTMSSGTLDVSGGIVNIGDELDVANGTVTITGGTINIGVYNGSNSYISASDRFEMDAGTLNLTAGTINVYGQKDDSDYDAIDIESSVTVNANANNTINLGPGAGSSDEDMYVRFDGNEIGSLTISNTSYKVLTEENIDLKGNLTISSGTLDIDAGNDHINLEGNLSVSGTLDATGEAITFDGSGAQTVGAISGNDAIVYVSKPGGTLTTTGDLALDELRVTAGTMLVDGEDVSVDDQLIVSGGTLQITSGLIKNTRDGAYTTISGGTIDVDGGELRIGDLASDNSADIDMSSGTLDVSGGTVNICDELDVADGTVTITGGVLNIGAYTGSSNGESVDRFEMDAGTLNLTAGTINIMGQNSSSSYDALDLAGGVTVNANTNNTINLTDGGGSSDENMYITLGGNTVGTLQTSNTSNTVYAEDAIAATNLTVSDGTLEVQANSTISGTTDVDGTLSIGTTTFTASGSSDIDGTFTASTGVYDANSSFDATNGTIDFTGAGTLKLSTTPASLGNLDDAAGTVEYDGGTQDVLADDYYNLEIDQSGVKTAQGTVTAAGTLTVQTNATYAIAATTSTVTGATDLNGTLTASTGILDANGSFDATNGTIDFTGAGTLRLGGTVTHLGTLDDAAGKVEYDLATQAVFADTYYDLTISTAGTKTAGGVITVNNDLVTAATSNCKLDMGANNLVLKGDLNVGATDGLNLSNASCVFTMGGSSAQGITHAGSTGNSSAVSETAESGLGSFTASGSVSFATTTNYYKNGSKSFWNHYTSSNSSYLSSTSNIDLSSNSGAELTFWHIAKTEGGYDKCRVQYSENGGSSWTTFPNSKYEGSAGDYSSKVYFHEDSYATWGTGSDTPNNSTWWKQETFDMDFLAGQNDIRIRFYVYSDGSVERAGWYIDDIVVTGTNSSGSDIKNLTIDNSTAITLASDIYVEGTLSITSGSKGIKTGSNTLTIDPAGSMTRGAKSYYGGKSSQGKTTGGAPCECVEGNVMQKASTSGETIYYNIGDVDDQIYAPVWVKPTGTTDNFKLKFNNSAYSSLTTDATLDHVDQGMYWDISRRNDADNADGSTDNALIALDWSSADGVDAPSDIRLAHWNGSAWVAVTTNHGIGTTSSAGGTIPFASGSAASASGGSVSATASSFSPFTLGSTTTGNPLPIVLVSFSGECDRGQTELEFIVASQINNDYFTIERSIDNKKWKTIGEIPGVGNTSTQMTYNFTDYSPMQGLSYYRLSQTDYDGESETFAPITVTCEDDAIGGYNAYPNPAKDELMIDIELDTYQGDDIQLQLIDINGKVAKQKQVELDRGFNHFQVELNELPNGIYLLQFTGTKNHIKEQRIIKQ